jgi:hypothetical protein
VPHLNWAAAFLSGSISHANALSAHFNLNLSVEHQYTRCCPQFLLAAVFINFRNCLVSPGNGDDVIVSLTKGGSIKMVVSNSIQLKSLTISAGSAGIDFVVADTANALDVDGNFSCKGSSVSVLLQGSTAIKAGQLAVSCGNFRIDASTTTITTNTLNVTSDGKFTIDARTSKQQPNPVQKFNDMMYARCIFCYFKNLPTKRRFVFTL